MKKNIIALAVASAIAAPVAMADAPTVYGKIYMSIDNLTDAGTTVNSHSSRFGIKGSNDLGNGLKAVYKLEFGVDPTTTAKAKISGRNAYVGLAGGFGTVLMGRHDTPFKMIQGTDLFNDATKEGYGDNKPMAGGLGISGGEVRADNVLAYVSPSFNGVKFIAAGMSAGNNDGGNTTYYSTAPASNKDNSLTNAYSIAAMYGSKKKGLYLAAAYNSFDKKMTKVTNGSDSPTETRLVAQYTVAGLMANAMYQNFDKEINNTVNGKNLNGSNIQINVGYKMGALMPKLKYSMFDYKDKTLKDGNAFGVGVNYSLAKSTTAMLDYVSYDKNLANKGVAGGKSTSLISLGIVTKF
ncbi:hypothetical protein EI16_09435 [Hydrogenovibrio marinus]|uniref:Porin domain-containing protein n=2 Tax=Hydrogenovibrio marinus TaxID=28885 RepID=A0A066ZW16_HYDMR|nr:hypothetical protein EI16_09435 [Hydrogenovibrio marinus]